MFKTWNIHNNNTCSKIQRNTCRNELCKLTKQEEYILKTIKILETVKHTKSAYSYFTYIHTYICMHVHTHMQTHTHTQLPEILTSWAQLLNIQNISPSQFLPAWMSILISIFYDFTTDILTNSCNYSRIQSFIVTLFKLPISFFVTLLTYLLHAAESCLRS